jgi:hypothetical protein
MILGIIINFVSGKPCESFIVGAGIAYGPAENALLNNSSLVEPIFTLLEPDP